ncbi:MAG: hypothetical protein CL554_19520 [Algoriphagus sp.]|uniref:hypothetical protein n=1 Tax=Algoriphagus sp. TaxID=1872435 RepID=UPI000C356D73|nr:hypothetical protein [Algoriphagus sp.]MAL15603.1 hypothetical protein [Algoriphagus sp.]
MAFLDNSGDIILDAVLTDTGRLRLAQGDGSFKISKFALGDDEINYELYNKNHASGSAYHDLQVLQTPILEAFTNNTSNLKTKLITISRTNILFMPVLKLNKNNHTSQVASSKTFNRDETGVNNSATAKTDSRFYVAVDQDTHDILTTFSDGTASGIESFETAGLTRPTGIIKGYGAGEETVNRDFIRIDQGLDTTEISPGVGLSSDLLETAYLVELDHRLGVIKPPTTNVPAPVNFIDDDSIASYYLSNSAYIGNTSAVTILPQRAQANDGSRKLSDLVNIAPQVFEGPRGNCLTLRLHASDELQSSTFLFTQLGFSATAASNSTLGLANTTQDPRLTGKTAFFIDSTVRVIGANTGFRIDIPVRYVKIA